MKKVLKKILELFGSNSGKKELIHAYVNRSTAYSFRTMKKATLLFVFVFAGLFTTDSNAQILKKLGKKIEQQAERRAERKVDKTIDKGFDKVEDGLDKSIKEGTKENNSKKEPEGELADNEINFLT